MISSTGGVPTAAGAWLGGLLASSPQATSNTTARPHTGRKALVEKQLGAALRNASGANGKGTMVGIRSKMEDYRPRSNGSPDVPAHAVSGHLVVLPAPTRHWNSPCRPSRRLRAWSSRRRSWPGHPCSMPRASACLVSPPSLRPPSSSASAPARPGASCSRGCSGQVRHFRSRPLPPGRRASAGCRGN